MENIDDFADTIDAEPSVEIALDAAQFAAFDDEAETGMVDMPVAPAAPIPFVPDAVQGFLVSLYRAVRARAVSDIYHLYESNFNRLTERFFKGSPWPRPDTVMQITGGDRVFMVLYKELYFRHIYSRLQPTLDQRFESWQNYVELFNLFLNGDGVDFELPDHWLWDIVDEYVYQFQAYCQWKHKTKGKTEEEIARIRGAPQVWSAPVLLRTLYALADRSNVVAVLERERSGADASATDEPAVPEPAVMYKMLGYFSLVALVRVHSLLGDYYSALQALGPIDLSRKGLFARVPACHITLFYYVAFAYLMTRRYVEAIRTFSNILLYISRTERYHSRSYQYDQIVKKNDQMFALLALALSLCPQRVDETLHGALRERFQDKMYRMQRGDEAPHEELFQYACPKFVVAAAPFTAGDVPAATATDAYRHQMRLLMQEVRQQALIPTVRSFLRLYSTIDVKKLADFTELDESAFRAILLCYKHKTALWTEGTKGRFNADVDFYVDNDMIHINDTKAPRRYTDFFTQAIADLNRGQ